MEAQINKDNTLKKADVFIPISDWNRLKNKHRELAGIIPDFLLEIKDDGLQLTPTLCKMSKLQIEQVYHDMLHACHTNNPDSYTQVVINFLKQKINLISLFIGQNTIITIAEAIIHHQRRYFLNNGSELFFNPMILKDICDISGFDKSVVSRVSNSTYLQTPTGLFSLKFFFSEGLKTTSGGKVSTREVKVMLQDCIEKEDKRKPFSDNDLVDVLQKKGFLIARRTVAKYREQLKIPIAQSRKK
jgi:RNA polymerase sigma-54 factor